MNLPNILTLSRILMIPVFVIIYYLPAQWSYLVSAGLFALAAATDWLDGYLARKLNQSTPSKPPGFPTNVRNCYAWLPTRWPALKAKRPSDPTRSPSSWRVLAKKSKTSGINNGC